MAPPGRTPRSAPPGLRPADPVPDRNRNAALTSARSALGRGSGSAPVERRSIGIRMHRMRRSTDRAARRHRGAPEPEARYAALPPRGARDSRPVSVSPSLVSPLSSVCSHVSALFRSIGHLRSSVTESLALSSRNPIPYWIYLYLLDHSTLALHSTELHKSVISNAVPVAVPLGPARAVRKPHSHAFFSNFETPHSRE
jgi:hypothetical protein